MCSDDFVRSVAQRAQNARQAMDAYFTATGDDNVFMTGPPYSPGAREDMCASISDLMADLLHLHDATGCTECTDEEFVRQAFMHWDAERELPEAS